jgi:hypothetical protein
VKKTTPHQPLENQNLFSLPNNLWKRLLQLANIPSQTPSAQLSNPLLQHLANKLCRDPYSIDGKTTYKQEFVTCGGIATKEVDFKTMESKLCKGLYFAGEILDIDGITGGFNFQNAWTTGWIAGQAII